MSRIWTRRSMLQAAGALVLRHAIRNAMATLFLRREGDECLEFATPAFQRLRLDNKEVAS